MTPGLDRVYPVPEQSQKTCCPAKAEKRRRLEYSAGAKLRWTGHGLPDRMLSCGAFGSEPGFYAHGKDVGVKRNILAGAVKYGIGFVLLGWVIWQYRTQLA